MRRARHAAAARHRPDRDSPLSPNIQISEIVGTRIRYRLAGTAIVEAYGEELAGKYFDEVFSGDRLRFVETNYRMMCDEKRPVLVRNRYLSSRDVELVCTRLIMPLSEDGETVTQCLTAMSFQFPGEAVEWTGQWFGNSGNFDFAKSYPLYSHPLRRGGGRADPAETGLRATAAEMPPNRGIR